jgi:hypothetical protein
MAKRSRAVTVRQETVGLLRVKMWVAHCGTCGPMQDSMSRTRKGAQEHARLHRAQQCWRRWR